MDDSDKYDEFDDPVISLEISEDEKVYTLKIFSQKGRNIPEPEFILALEAWLHEIAQSHSSMADPGTSIH